MTSPADTQVCPTNTRLNQETNHNAYNLSTGQYKVIRQLPNHLTVAAIKAELQPTTCNKLTRQQRGQGDELALDTPPPPPVWGVAFVQATICSELFHACRGRGVTTRRQPIHQTRPTYGHVGFTGRTRLSSSVRNAARILTRRFVIEKTPNVLHIFCYSSHGQKDIKSKFNTDRYPTNDRQSTNYHAGNMPRRLFFAFFTFTPR